GEELHIRFQRADALKKLGEEEQKVFDSFLKRMCQLGVIAREVEEGPGAYRFVNNLHFVYFWMQATPVQAVPVKAELDGAAQSAPGAGRVPGRRRVASAGGAAGAVKGRTGDAEPAPRSTRSPRPDRHRARPTKPPWREHVPEGHAARRGRGCLAYLYLPGLQC